MLESDDMMSPDHVLSNSSSTESTYYTVMRACRQAAQPLLQQGRILTRTRGAKCYMGVMHGAHTGRRLLTVKF